MNAPTLSEVAVVTVSYNSASVLKPFIASAIANGVPPANIVVVDNNASEAAAKKVANGLSATYLPLKSNVGYGAAINEGAASLPNSIRYVIIANPDVTFNKGAISALVDGLTKTSGDAAVGPRILNEDGSTYPSARELPAMSTGIGHALFSKVWPTNPWTKKYRNEGFSPDHPREVGWLSGALIAIPLELFRRMGGFDDNYFMYFEDVDLGERLHRLGGSCIYWPAATVTHTGAHSTTTHSDFMLKTHHESASRYLSKKYSGWYFAPVRVALRAGLALRYRTLTKRS